MKYTKEKLLERLEADLLSERAAIRIYWYQVERVRDPDIALLLKSIANVEANHIPSWPGASSPWEESSHQTCLWKKRRSWP